jgi:hypothetical protein
MERRLITGPIVAVALAFGAGPGHASVPGIIIESARTVADSVRDGALTLGRTTRAFVLGGPRAAEDAWYDNVEVTRERARRNAEQVRREADLARADRHREYRYDDDRGYDDPDYDRYDRDRDYRYEYRDEPLPPAVPDDRY